MYKRTAQCLVSFFPCSCPYLRCASCNCITRRPLSQGQACVDAARRLAFVMLTNTFLRSLFVVSVGTPGRLSLHRVTVHIRRGLRCGRVDSCIYLGIAAVLFPQSGTFFQYTLAAHVTSNHETCHVQSEWEETLCLPSDDPVLQLGRCSATSSTTPSSC